MIRVDRYSKFEYFQLSAIFLVNSISVAKERDLFCQTALLILEDLPVKNWRGFGPHTDGMGVEVCPVHKTDFKKTHCRDYLRRKDG
ncbi:hypothetical protein HNY73_008458 [Argiope bruennichi]|uniref:Uncharacterized protein n=1 Tax=Argiope bruennichi TaxID=94029 RepID=A0A8T0F6H5_ARGBR|nr:hypothetical protein HNY73_008458 [Argiope bruennichi]